MAQRLPLKILVADDNPVHQKVSLLMLLQMGYRADVAADGREALDAYRGGRHDLIFMDMQMPVMDGLESAAKIRALDPSRSRNPVILALTASAVSGDRDRCLAAGMNDILIKPVLLEQLQNAILQWCNGEAPVAAASRAAAPTADALAIPLLDQIPPESRQEVLEQLVRAYLEDSPGRIRELRDAVVSGKHDILRSQAHALKGASSLMGLLAMAGACAELEMLDETEMAADAAELVDRIGQEFDAACRQLSDLQSKSGGLSS